MRTRAIAALLAAVLMGAVEPCRDFLPHDVLDYCIQHRLRRQAPCGLLRCVAAAHACRGDHAKAGPSSIVQPLRGGASLRGSASTAYGDDTPMHAVPQEAPVSWESARTASFGGAGPAFGGSLPDAMEDMEESPAGVSTPASPEGGIAPSGSLGGGGEGGDLARGGFGGVGGVDALDSIGGGGGGGFYALAQRALERRSSVGPPTRHKGVSGFGFGLWVGLGSAVRVLGLSSIRWFFSTNPPASGEGRTVLFQRPNLCNPKTGCLFQSRHQ